MQKKYQPFRIIPNNVEYVISTLGNGKTFTITKELDDDLINKSNEYKKSIKEGENKIPKAWIYGLWLNSYFDSEYEFYPDPINLNIYETKFKKWRTEWSKTLLYYFSL